ncbi:hypothetical protein NW762_012061 [Fusarium torreyae]|uniref:Uncharacterized protein n=1 Tax=Fusarium torreyae TaxID=1237075 RepID=A0A9W8RQ75_9HYPO|nr:hypothetical protein NW762_012061 [Fusarium torreyae]
MQLIAVLGLLSVAAALPTVSKSSNEDSLVVARNEIDTSSAHLEQREHASILIARALHDQTADWPATSLDIVTYSFSIRLEKQSNGKYLLTWWNSDAANSKRDIKLTLNSGSGSRIYDIVTKPQTRGTAEINPSTSSFRAIFDEQ